MFFSFFSFFSRGRDLGIPSNVTKLNKSLRRGVTFLTLCFHMLLSNETATKTHNLQTDTTANLSG